MFRLLCGLRGSSICLYMRLALSQNVMTAL